MMGLLRQEREFLLVNPECALGISRESGCRPGAIFAVKHSVEPVDDRGSRLWKYPICSLLYAIALRGENPSFLPVTACSVWISNSQKRPAGGRSAMPAPDRIIRLNTVLARTGLSRSTICRKIAEGTFPV